MGMGGSSLFPEVIARIVRRPPTGRLRLHVLDSTDPRRSATSPPTSTRSTTLFVASSKSGLHRSRPAATSTSSGSAIGRGDRFAVVTDPGSELGALARERGLPPRLREPARHRRPVLGAQLLRPGPAALAGVDWTALAGRADRPRRRRCASADPAVNAGLRLGAVLGAAVQAGRDKLTLLIDPSIEAFGLWLEQLLAESTGKHGTGVVPVADEALGPIDVYGDDRLFVSIGDVEHPIGLDVLADAGHPVVELDLGDPLDLGAQVLAVGGGHRPLRRGARHQPVRPAQRGRGQGGHQRRARVRCRRPARPPRSPTILARGAARRLPRVQAYIDPAATRSPSSQEIRLELRDELKVATTFGLGPRFLHSTGQLHKGGPPTGVFLQVVGDDLTDADIPGRAFTFSQLKHAQADGDLLTLARHGLRAARVTLAELTAHVDQGEPQ